MPLSSLHSTDEFPHARCPRAVVLDIHQPRLDRVAIDAARVRLVDANILIASYNTHGTPHVIKTNSVVAVVPLPLQKVASKCAVEYLGVDPHCDEAVKTGALGGAVVGGC
ncbi:hypothetical protein FOMPIDRAFT_1056314 [Fomitopsis schrenkii]|uniref:Uncharacterized protein n=1 Tax=Fomitopsis schrenkii TaxID=2126942 RepID=S8DJR6_FOMSC|nr:hypothetical protein FOMPIDRAFT_1056314 [Fomitopsis schrenkii]